ncbi:3-keto-5-aminohexanoate cleavage protein [Planococcus halotolerans]|uniref:3-keto-5-aminohexanoate cleavage protein n=1 Tax=Planococcus halotolerans TaxID=2233542 RepID=A0A365L1G0_9BACL|nr:3-keto-5-aminohexanoate cleavage protein [Planococcus halotolerans]QHJ70969.1 hypothetical protein DNR44_010270 [Planococcus halotolerans]RAZ79268.1 hypothetical protein DP120_06530 [Planococcus halotolerans]
MVIKVCLNGGRTKRGHAGIPVTLDEIIGDIHTLRKLGVEHFHVHLRDNEGMETFENHLLAPQMRVLKQRFPDIKIGLSSNLFNGMTPERRYKNIRGWEFRPDYISVNLSEPGSIELWNLLKNKGIKPEAGIWSLNDAEIFVKNNLDQFCERVLIEMFFEEREEAIRQANQISTFIAEHNHSLEQVHHGEGINTWAVIDNALAKNCGVRIGLEDTLVLRSGIRASGNGELYRELMMGLSAL